MMQTRRRTPLVIRIAAPIALGGLIMITWHLVVANGGIPPTLLPPPGRVLDRLTGDLCSGRLNMPMLVTLSEALLGCVLAALVALPIAWSIVHYRLIDALTAPYLAASQALPAVAIAPLLAIWLGYGRLPVVVLCSVMVFFPMVLATALGLRGIDRDIMDAARVDGASAGQLARWLEWPMALPATLTGIRNGCTLSITGAVVGELVMGGSGLGQRLAVQSQSHDTVGLFVTLLVLCTLAIGCYLLVTLIEYLTNPYR